MLNKLMYFYKIFSNPTQYARRMGVKIGNNSQIAKSLDFGSEPYLIKIGENFYSSENVSFVTHDGSLNVLRNLSPNFRNSDIFGVILVGNNVFLGRGVTVLLGSKIEDNVIVGANSLVKGLLSKNSVYAGSPARFICTLEEYAEKIKNDIHLTKNLPADKKRSYLTNWLRSRHPEF